MSQADLTREDRKRSDDRFRVLQARRSHRQLRLLWLLVGPGLLVMLGENDGPSMLSYAATGARYGEGFFVGFVLVTFLAALVVQEMAVRVGAITHRGFGQLIRQRYGRFWGLFSSIDLQLTNLLTLITELIAVEVGLSFFGIPAPVGVALVVGLLLVAVTRGRYWTWERTAMSLAAFNLLFVVAAVLASSQLHVLPSSASSWAPPIGNNPAGLVLFLAADLGATVTPWMVFFQQSAVVDKGLTPKDLTQGRVDTALGAFLAALSACSVVVLTSVLHGHGGVLPRSASGTGFAWALEPVLGYPVAALFSIGLIESGLVAALTITASSAYASGEAAGAAHSLNRSVREAPLFYAVNIGQLLLAAVVVLLPGAPLLAITLGVNVVATVLMPPTLVFLLLLSNDRDLMGGHANGPLGNTMALLVVIAVAASGTAYAVYSVLGLALGGRLP